MTLLTITAAALAIAVPVALICSSFYLLYCLDRELAKAEIEAQDLRSQLRELNVLLLFAGYEFYPEGGWLDAAGSFETIEQAIRSLENMAIDMVFVKANPYDWAHIVDARTGEIVWAGVLRTGISKDKAPAPGDKWYEIDDKLKGTA